MNTLRNTVTLIGNLGQDPVITKFGENNAVARFTIATNERFNSKEGETITETTWHNVVVWGKLAERCEKILKKGSSVIVVGKIGYNNYETKEGEKRYKTEITVRGIELLDKVETDAKEVANA